MTLTYVRFGVTHGSVYSSPDLLEATAADNAITEGKRKVLGVMQKDGKRFAGTGGWGFEGFAAGDPARPVVGQNARTACFECHTATTTFSASGVSDQQHSDRDAVQQVRKSLGECKCPLWVMSGHCVTSASCPLFPSKADIHQRDLHVRLVPLTDIGST